MLFSKSRAFLEKRFYSYGFFSLTPWKQFVPTTVITSSHHRDNRLPPPCESASSTVENSAYRSGWLSMIWREPFSAI